MLWLYNFGIFIYGLIVRLVAPFNSKAKLFVEGRKNIFTELAKRIDPSDKHIWFHFASLGEFEQGRPVLEMIKDRHPGKKIVLTFFSPSGYEVRKNFPLASGVFYLPLDTAHNASRFIKAINPELAIFTKYEFWHHYYRVLNASNIPLFLISGIFRKNQIFFKSYGNFYRDILRKVTHFFVQNEESLRLMKSLNIDSVSIAGDTRFDRVYENSRHPADIPLIKQFCNNHKVFIAGSTWPQDEQLIKSLVEQNKDWKFIIAPHEIDEGHIAQIEKLLPDAMKFSIQNQKNNGNGTSNFQAPTKLSSAYGETAIQTIIIDNIGLLSSLYRYADLAYIGGGFGAGIHNTLEAAAFGIPILFGPNYHKFQEAKDLLELGAAISVQNQQELDSGFQKLKDNSAAGNLGKDYVLRQKGATAAIFQEIEKYLS
jgi:3-deoxy-D-manno-octulosonic-acid transferase